MKVFKRIVGGLLVLAVLGFCFVITVMAMGVVDALVAWSIAIVATGALILGLWLLVS